MMKFQRYKRIVLVVLILSCFFSCKKNPGFHVNVKKINLDVKIDRFDKSLQKLTPDNYNTEIWKVNAEYPKALSFFVEQLARGGRIKDSSFVDPMSAFFFDKYTQELYQNVADQYPDLKSIEKELTKAFKHVKYYFPDTTIPTVYSIVTNFGVSAASFEDMLFLSLEFYMGNDYKYYEGMFPKYKYKYFSKPFIVSDLMQVQFMKMFPEEENSGNNLLSKMIYQGKILFFQDLMMPDLKDSIKIKYSKDQLKWCNKYEGEIWNQLLLNKIIYETQSLKIGRYLDDAPFTNSYGIPSDSPPRLAAWIGWQIVRLYVEKNCKENPIQVFFEKDAQKILTLSGYKPRI